MIDLPSVKPSAIALGTIFNHGVELAVLTPLFGQTYNRAKAANSNEEFIRSKEASSAAVAWGTSLVGSALQAYGVGALINATGTLSYKGAAYLGALIFMATSAPGVSFSLITPFPHRTSLLELPPSPVHSPLTPPSTLLRSSPKSDPSTLSELASPPRSSRRSAKHCSSPGGEPGRTPSNEHHLSILSSEAGRGVLLDQETRNRVKSWS